ncbi:major facilitator superfamily domain-containing protein [Limtongia smithiae]|uniref:major facilitator superfamily domain-containing protein n=1 Tax=Limtongia smithiae TaxID=1125753 RepID=UPI0034CDF399
MVLDTLTGSHSPAPRCTSLDILSVHSMPSQPTATEREMEAQEVAELFHEDLIPGTELMTDLTDVHFVRNAAGKVLVPQPHNDPRDPLNWDVKWKLLSMFGMFLMTITTAMGPLSIAPQVSYYMAEWDRSLADVLQFTGVCILVLGFSNFLWVPITTRYGRRPCAILSGLLGLGCCIWRAKATSYNSMFAASALHGVAAGPGETFGPIVIADVMFLHERGLYMTLYLWAYMGMLMIGPIIAGAMTLNYGWRSFWWFCVALYALQVAYCVALFPETKWNRNAETPQDIDPTSVATEAEKATVDAEHEDKAAVVGETDSEKTAAAARGDNTATTEHVGARIEHHDNYLWHGAPCKSQFAFVSSLALGYDNDIKRIFLVPFQLFMYPIVQFGGFVFSFSASSFLVINLTQSQVFEVAPYNMNVAQIGYTNFGLWIGATIGMFTAGPLSDWISMRATKKNHGIREPEMRLPTLIPYGICLFVGSMVTMFGYYNEWRWPVIVVIGFGLVGMQVAALPAIALTYAVDSYKPVAGEVLLNVTINKNLWAYGVSKFITPWIEKSGYLPPLGTELALSMLWLLFGIPLYFFGKHARRWSRNSSVHRM